MIARSTLAAGFALAAVAAAGARAELTIAIYTSESPIAPTSTLIMGESESILIDAQFLLSDAQEVVDLVTASGTTLTAVYITHPHPDHYFGAGLIKEAFPEARVVARSEVVEGIERSWRGRRDFWAPTYGDDLPEEALIPEVLEGDTLTLEGETLEIHGGLQGDSAGDNSYVWIPAIRTVVGGDILFSGVHMPVLQPEAQAAWIAVIEEIAALEPEIVVAGHHVRGAPLNGSVPGFMLGYFAAFAEARAASATAEELRSMMVERYPDLALEGMLGFTTAAAFPPAQ
jgi:glyoxylase-like metal-dependent hydrolase (beta-lactamase superfamily II)